MTSPVSLRIAVAEDDPAMVKFYQETLTRLGHQVQNVSSGRQLLELCRAAPPDLVIADIKIPELDGLEAAARLYESCPVPIILASNYSDPDLVQRAADAYVMAYLVKPITEAELNPAIVVALRRFQEFQALRKEVEGLKQALEERKTVERAKGALMRRLGVDEEEAYRRLRRKASDEGRKLVDVAQEILRAEGLFREMDYQGKR